LRRLVAEWERRNGFPEGLAYFLRRDELAAPPPDAAHTAAERQATWRRRRLERAPLMLPAPFRMLGLDVSRHLAGGRQPGDALARGVGVSPGTATGPACVVFSPSDADLMEPGGVLIAPLTNPAWTALMSIASAIVTDTGGPMSHASIVAREFGFPAVVGAGHATCVVVHGSSVTVDGDEGTVMLADTLDTSATE
jgi:pyruvate,water dikinase